MSATYFYPLFRPFVQEHMTPGNEKDARGRFVEFDFVLSEIDRLDALPAGEYQEREEHEPLETRMQSLLDYLVVLVQCMHIYEEGTRTASAF